MFPVPIINKTGTVLFPVPINCLSVWMDGCLSPFHFESVTLCVGARNILTSNCEQKRTLHFSMTGNFFSMTGNFFASPGNFFAFDSLHFWMTKCTERRLLLLGEGARSATDLSMLLYVCELSVKVKVVGRARSATALRWIYPQGYLPLWFYHPWVYQSCSHAIGIY